MKGPYDDIIHLPHPDSVRHPRMPMESRAAQFSPFAALTGHSAAIEETARLTDRRIELSEELKAELDMKQQLLLDAFEVQPEISVTYFLPDPRKSGGKYVTAAGNLKRFDVYERLLILTDGTKIPLDDITKLDFDLNGI